MMVVVTLLIGVVAGSRTAMAPAVVALAAWLGWIDLGPTWAAFLGSGLAVVGLTALATGELVADQLPSTPSRKAPQQFGARIVSGAFSGAALGALYGGTLPGLVLGAAGAAAGTLGGAALRGRMAAGFGADRPAAFIEDAAAVLLGLVAVAAAS